MEIIFMVGMGQVGRNLITKRVILILVLVLLFSSLAFAETSTWTSVVSGGGSGSGGGYITSLSAGVLSSGKSKNLAYQSIAGFMAGLFASQDTTGPVIADLKVNGSIVKANDFIQSSPILTATITDGSGISTPECYAGYDSTTIYFSALTGTSSYNIATGALTMDLGTMMDGTHALKIFAKDSVGNTSSVEVSVKVDTGDVKADAVLVYPNPFNPNQGNLRIAYKLSKDAAVTIYVFNAVNQPIYKRDIASGADGGHAGYNEVTWNGVDNFGEQLANDIYFARIVADGKKVIGKVKIAVVK
jgi:hypothetical protein